MLYHTILQDFPQRTSYQDTKNYQSLWSNDTLVYFGYSGKSPSTAALLISLMSSSPAKGEWGYPKHMPKNHKESWKSPCSPHTFVLQVVVQRLTMTS